MNITVEDLKQICEQLIEDEKGHYQIRLLMQPSWPFIYSVGHIGTRMVESKEGTEEVEEEVLYLCERNQIAYGFSFENIDTVW